MDIIKISARSGKFTQQDLRIVPKQVSRNGQLPRPRVADHLELAVEPFGNDGMISGDNSAM